MRGLKHIVQYSGGICSFFAAKRVVEKFGKENVILLFADTNFEDKDLYRFAKETVEYLQCEFVRVSDGRTPIQVYKDMNFLGNSRVAHCTKILKIKQCKDWLKANYKPDECTLYLGIDWREEHRCKAIEHNWQPYQVEFPMCNTPFLTKEQMEEELNNIGIEIPRLYKLGFTHNNCGGFCCKAGQSHWIRVLEVMPDKFKEWEEAEQEVIRHIGKDVAMMKKTKNGVTKPYTLRQLRIDYERRAESEDKQC